MASSKNTSRPLRFESLERREVMAGNVMGSVANGLLTLTGNYLGNALVAYNGAEAGQVVIAGAKDYAGGNTLVNNSEAPVTFSGVKSIKLDMRGGNDRALFTNLTLPDPAPGLNRSIVGDMGADNDQVVISGDTGTPRGFTLNNNAPITYGPVILKGTAYVLGRGGNDTFNIVNATFSGLSNVVSGFDGGDGDDAFNVDGSLAQNKLSFVTLNMSSGIDTISIKRAQFDGLRIYAPLNNSPGTANISLFNVQSQGIDIELLASAQVSVQMDTVINSYSVGIQTNKGNDTVYIKNLHAKELDVVTYDNSDTVTIMDSVIDDMFSDAGDPGLDVSLGAGNDTLTIKNVTVKNHTTLNGGLDTDQLIDQGGNSLGTAIKASFES